MTTTATGTTCVTQAEDAVFDALKNSASWRAVCEAANPTAAEANQFFDEMPLPADGFAFSLDELVRLRVAALIFTDPEDGFSITQGSAQDHVIEAGRVLIVIERWVRESEAATQDNQQRWLKDKLGNAQDEIFQYLTDTKGHRWMQRVAWKQLPTQWDQKQKSTRGRRQQAMLAVEWGGAPGPA